MWGWGTEVQLQRATHLVLACPLVLWEARACLGWIRVGRGPREDAATQPRSEAGARWVQLPKNRIHPVGIFKAIPHRGQKKSLDF